MFAPDWPGPAESYGTPAARRRNYQACIECKKHKVKCFLGDPNHPKPPCVRCRRARLLCVFGPARRLRPRAGRVNNTAAPPAHDEEEPTEPSGPINPGSLDAISDTTLQEIAPTADIRPTEPCYSRSCWEQSALCREGYIAPAEAEHLIGHFFRWMHPLYPLVDHKYSAIANWGQLITEEPLLCATILAITSRYTWNKASTSSARATEVPGVLYRRLQSDIQRCIWASEPGKYGTTKTLSLIESIMLIVEWHPRSLDLVLPSIDVTGNYALEFCGYDPAPRAPNKDLECEVRRAWDTFKPVNISSWRLLCNAVSLADEIGLHQVITTANTNECRGDIARRAHVREFLVSLVWERSFRMGRRCLLNNPPGESEPMQLGCPAHPLADILQCRNELYRLVRLIEDTIYPTFQHTSDMITNRSYKSAVSSFSGLLVAWRTRFERVKDSSPPFAKHLDIMWHNVRCFLHSIALLAYVSRDRSLSSRASPRAGNSTSATAASSITPMEQPFEDHEMIKVMIQESERVIGLAMELYRDELLRYIPLNVLYHTITASMILLKVERLPLRPNEGSIDLLEQLAQVLEESSIDDAHACSRYASCLRRMIQRLGEHRLNNPSQAPDSALDANNINISLNAPECNVENPPSAGRTGSFSYEWLETPVGPVGGSLQDQLGILGCDDDWIRWLSF